MQGNFQIVLLFFGIQNKFVGVGCSIVITEQLDNKVTKHCQLTN